MLKNTFYLYFALILPYCIFFISMSLPFFYLNLNFFNSSYKNINNNKVNFYKEGKNSAEGNDGSGNSSNNDGNNGVKDENIFFFIINFLSKKLKNITIRFSNYIWNMYVFISNNKNKDDEVKDGKDNEGTEDKNNQCNNEDDDKGDGSDKDNDGKDNDDKDNDGKDNDDKDNKVKNNQHNSKNDTSKGTNKDRKDKGSRDGKNQKEDDKKDGNKSKESVKKGEKKKYKEEEGNKTKDNDKKDSEREDSKEKISDNYNRIGIFVKNFFNTTNNYVDLYLFLLKLNLKMLILLKIIFGGLIQYSFIGVFLNQYNCWLELIFLSLILFFYSNLDINKIDIYQIYITTIFIITNVFLIHTTNIVLIFILVELNIYIYIILSIIIIFRNLKKKNLVANSLLKFFFLNFITTILFFCSIVNLVYYSGNLSIAINMNTNYSYLFLLFLLLKISSGPWLFFGKEMYNSLSLPVLFLYSCSFFLIMMLKLFFIFNIFYTIYFFINLCLFICSYIIFIYKNMYKISSFKVFLAFSSSIISINLLILFSIPLYQL